MKTKKRVKHKIRSDFIPLNFLFNTFFINTVIPTESDFICDGEIATRAVEGGDEGGNNQHQNEIISSEQLIYCECHWLTLSSRSSTHLKWVMHVFIQKQANITLLVSWTCFCFLSFFQILSQKLISGDPLWNEIRSA